MTNRLNPRPRPNLVARRNRHQESSRILSASVALLSVCFFSGSTDLGADRFPITRAPASMAKIGAAPKGPVSLMKETLLALAERLPTVVRVQDSNPDRVTFEFRSDEIFLPGTARLDHVAADKTRNLFTILSKADANVRVEIGSHTDSTPVTKHRDLYESNWELSALRAGLLARMLSTAGFPEKSLRATGYGDSHPIVSDTDSNGQIILENLSKNRRIILTLSLETDLDAETL